MKECIFCDIANNLADSFCIYEDDDVKAFLDLFPKPGHEGHVLIIPKYHQKLLYEHDFDFNYINKVNLVARLMKDVLDFDGLKVCNNNGAIADQVVNHVHIHLIPYYADDKYRGKSVEAMYQLFQN